MNPADTTILTRQASGTQEVDRVCPCPVIRYPASPLLPSAGLRNWAREIIRSRKIDVVHFASALPLGLLGPQLLARDKVPYALSVHGGEFVMAARIPVLKQLLRTVMKHCALALPVSDFTLQYIRRFAPQTKTALVTPGVDHEVFTPGPERASQVALKYALQSKHILLSVSRLVARKGPATLISAMPKILSRHPNAHALIVGGGPDERRLRRLASSLAVSPSVTFSGPVQWRLLPPFYQAAEIFVLPTRERYRGLETEGFPLVYLEAASAGLPIIAGHAGGVREAVLHDETGLLINGASSAEAARAVSDLLDDQEKRAAMGRLGRERVIEYFTWDMIARRFQAALEETFLPV